jgi:putative acetyltransferase
MAAIREERPGDIRAIHELTADAFRPMPFSMGGEADVVDRLRADGDLAVSLVAEQDGRIVGHVAFSPAGVADEEAGWFGLGPISVRADLQRRGIGKSLMRRGFDILKDRDARGCVLIGNPDIYSKVGFASEGRLAYRALDPALVQWIVFRGQPPSGAIRFADALQG